MSDQSDVRNKIGLLIEDLREKKRKHEADAALFGEVIESLNEALVCANMGLFDELAKAIDSAKSKLVAA
jgi:hypothetical protein